MEEHEFLESLSPAGDRPAPSSYPIPLENLWGVGWGGGSSTAEARGSPALTHAPWGFTPHPGALPQNHFTPHGVGFTSAPPRWGSRCPSPPSAPSRSSERTRRSCRSSAPGSTAWGRGGGGKRGPVRLRGPVPGRAEPARCDPPGPGPTRFPTHTLPPPRFGTCRLFMRRTSSRKSSDSIASPDRGGCTARPAPLPLPAPLLPPPAASARRTAASGPAPSGRRQRGGRGGQGQGRRAGRHPWMLLFAILRSKHHSKARTPLRVK